MNSHFARVSIVIPFYRAGRFLEEAIESVFNQQGFTDWHAYLVNDGSDDCDVEIARQFSRSHPEQITLLTHPRQMRRGISASRNLAIQHARGELIAFLDADDTWYPHKLRFQTEALENCQAADMIYGPALRWSSWDGGLDQHVPATVDGFGTDCVAPGTALLSTFLRDEKLTPCTSSVMIRRSAIQRVGGFEEQFRGVYDDQVLYAKISSSSRILVSSECVARYRRHPNSCCQQARAENIGESERARFLSWLEHYQPVDTNATSESAQLLPSTGFSG